jgi:hypothetical protein
VVKPDFVPVSWYKVFGYPTGVGCLIARREALGRLRRPWFAGGSVHMATVQGDWHTPAANEACFERSDSPWQTGAERRGAGPHGGSVPGPARPTERRGAPRIRGTGIERRRRGAIPRVRGDDLPGSRGPHGRPRTPAGLLSAVADRSPGGPMRHRYAILEAPSALGHVPEHLGVERAPGSCSKPAWPTVSMLAGQAAFRRAVTAACPIRGPR